MRLRCVWPFVQIPIVDALATIVFWAAVFALKGAVDWFAIIKPLEAPIKALWNHGWLSAFFCRHDAVMIRWNRNCNYRTC